MPEITKADWKLFREKLPNWQEHFMEKLSQEYIQLLQSPGLASDRFWELEERIKNDKRHPGVTLRMSKTEAVWNIASLVKLEVISLADLDGFSPELIETVKRMQE